MKTSNQKGFTLIELLVVIAIIGLLASVVLLSLNSARSKSRDAKRISDVKAITTALELYFNDCGQYPQQTGILGSANFTTLSSGNITATGCSSGFAAAATGATTYLGRISLAPTPPAATATCGVGTNTNTYSYSPLPAGSYTLSFCTEGPTGGLVPGNRTATPNGIQ